MLLFLYDELNVVISILESIVESPGHKIQHMYFPIL